jgi:hypothetical protein
MSGMVEKSDERAGKGGSGVRITPTEVSYMRDWRLTWRTVCDRKAVTEQRNAKAKFPGAEQDIGHIFPTNKEPQIHPLTSESTVALQPEGVYNIEV